MSEELRVYRKHLRQLGYCRKGSQRLADQLHVDWNRFLSEGIPISEIEGMDDENVKKLVAFVKGQKNGHQEQH